MSVTWPAKQHPVGKANRLLALSLSNSQSLTDAQYPSTWTPLNKSLLRRSGIPHRTRLRPRCTTLSWLRSLRAKALVRGVTGAQNMGPVRDACKGCGRPCTRLRTPTTGRSRSSRAQASTKSSSRWRNSSHACAPTRLRRMPVSGSRYPPFVCVTNSPRASISRHSAPWCGKAPCPELMT
jgi:hypothetical protein